MEKYNSNKKCKSSGGEEKKKEPGKRCVVMFCDKTNADGVSMHKFPTEEKVRRQWVSFVRQKRDTDSWKQGSGHICSDHFTPEDYHDYGMKVAGYASKMLLKKNAIPSRQVVPTPQQLESARKKKRKISDISEGSNVVTHEAGYTAAKRPSRTLAKLTANRVCILEFSFA